MTSAERAEETWRKVREQNVLAASWNECCVDVLTAAFEEVRREAACDALGGARLKVAAWLSRSSWRADSSLATMLDAVLRALQEKPTNG